MIRQLILFLQKEVKKHTLDYLLLITFGIFLITALSIFKGERLMEFIFILIFTSLYIIWGIYHHIINDTLRLKIVLEYVLIGFISLFLLRIIIFP
ncbi:MAG: hypothetical protein ACPL1D_00380 [Microgenomates group bacterium]